MILLAFFWLLLSHVSVEGTNLAEILNRAKEIEPWIVEIRRELHRIPELAFDLPLTSARVCKALDQLGVPYRHSLAESGIVAVIGQGNGPIVGLRADMDGLPIEERTGLEYASHHEGMMHACGHDAHTAMLLGAARLLKEQESALKGKVKLIFQPAEETGSGAQAMMETGELDDLTAILGLHVSTRIATQTMSTLAGSMLAGANEFSVTIRGRGCHAAAPHRGADAITTYANLVVAYQTIISRETTPLESKVVSISTVHGGTVSNIIPDSISFKGTMRSLERSGIAELVDRFKRLTREIAAAHDCTVEMKFREIAAPAINDPDLTALAVDTVNELLGSDTVVHMVPSMGADDFAYYETKVPGSFFYLGMGNKTAGAVYNVHSPLFKIDESMLHRGAAVHAAFAIRYLNKYTENKSHM